MAAPFETDEPAKLTARIPWLPLARRAVVMLFAYTSSDGWTTREAIDAVARSLSRTEYFYPAPALVLAFRVLALVLAGTLAAHAARLVSKRPRRPREPAVVRADAQGLHSGGRLVIARADLARVEIATDADVGFALWATTRAGWRLRVPVRTEQTARALAAALSPAGDLEPGGPGALVFPGVSGNRTREGVAAVGAAASVMLVFLAFVMLRRMSDLPTYWTWFKGWEAEITWTFAWWLDLVSHFGVVLTGLAIARALGPIARRAASGRVTVSPRGVEGLDRPVAPDAIADVTVGDASDATLALRDGRRVRVAFEPDRALSERDLFVARVREIAAGAPETSGVRVAREAAEAPAVEAPAEEDADADAQDDARRARRSR